MISIVNTDVPEAATNLTVFASRAGDLTQSSSFTYQTAPGTALPGINFASSSGTATFAPGTSTASFIIPILRDGKATGDLMFGVEAHNLVGATLGSIGTVTIHNTDPAPPPATQTCPDGSVIPADQTCPPIAPPPPPPPPPPAPAPGFTPDPMVAAVPQPLKASDQITGFVDIPSNFDTSPGASANPNFPSTAAPDSVGAFRFICGPGQVLADDPILYPGQPGRSHPHQFYGNTTANGNSTFASLRGAGGSTCGYWGDPAHAINRSAYWMPAMRDGKGMVVRPDFVAIYYKRRPAADPLVSDPAKSQFEGFAAPIPNGLRFIFGWDPTGKNIARTGAGYFNCQGPTSTPGHYATISEAAANCPAGQGNQLGAIIEAPDCWDGKNTDSADHRSHVGYSGYGSWGYLKCDAAHPIVIPTFTLGAWYGVEAGDDPRLWSLSSDDLVPGAAPGTTLHADYFEAWDNPFKLVWTLGCIDRLLNCSAGILGDGRILNGSAIPNNFLNGVFQTVWKASPHLVPLPPMTM